MTRPIFLAIAADLAKNRSADLERALVALHAVLADVQELDQDDRNTFRRGRLPSTRASPRARARPQRSRDDHPGGRDERLRPF
jgi:hypothetical protein